MTKHLKLFWRNGENKSIASNHVDINGREKPKGILATNTKLENLNFVAKNSLYFIISLCFNVLCLFLILA